ncbi:MAG: hypothetical protein QM744_16435 [Mesorhizobium sp.]
MNGVRLGTFICKRLKVRNLPERLPYIRELCSGRRVLHVGCTDYPVFNPEKNLHIQIRDVCAALDGLDLDKDGIEVLQRYVAGRYYTDVDDIKDAYDLVLVPETIEHVHNIKDFCRASIGSNLPRF